MKKFLGVVVALAATNVSAAEVKFGDLNYFLTQGRSLMSANLKWETSEVTEKNPGAGQETRETEGPVVGARYAYALNDSLNFFVGASYLYDNEVTPEGKSNFKQEGLRNPELGINYRVMKQADANFNLDVGAVARVAVDDQEIGSTVNGTSKNSNAYTRSGLELNARLGNKWDEANEFYTIAGLVYNQSGEITERSAAGDVEADLDSSFDLFLGGFYQYRPVNEFMITLGAEARRFGMVDADSSGSNFEITPHIDYTFSFAAKYLITENFIARFDYVGAMLEDYKYEIDGSPDRKYENRRFMSMGLSVDFLF
jgi:hypothetical protein